MTHTALTVTLSGSLSGQDCNRQCERHHPTVWEVRDQRARHVACPVFWPHCLGSPCSPWCLAHAQPAASCACPLLDLETENMCGDGIIRREKSKPKLSVCRALKEHATHVASGHRSLWHLTAGPPALRPRDPRVLSKARIELDPEDSGPLPWREEGGDMGVTPPRPNPPKEHMEAPHPGSRRIWETSGAACHLI